MKISSETRSFQMQIEFPNSCDLLQSRPVGGGGGGRGCFGCSAPGTTHTHNHTTKWAPEVHLLLINDFKQRKLMIFF